MYRPILLGCLLLGFHLQVQAQDSISFNRDIRPILSENCFHCHGPDERQRHGGLRLDQRDFAIAAAESGKTAIVPGNTIGSELLSRIHASDADQVMPPPTSGKSLKPEQKELLKKWIEQGAPYQGHLAFLRPERPAIPLGESLSHLGNPIDRFVLQRLQQNGFAFSPEASRETLIRRVTLDLTGLSPTPEEVAAFVADSSPQAYEKVVDRLLQSPHYGERMAIQWLDLARYADSNGFQIDSSRQQWPWRDWVIQAYNSNMPFDQFTLEQLAGDMLPNATLSQKVATGFNRNHRLNGEGGIIAEEWRVETVIDRVETTGLTWLGLTLNCCRCHDHKYDPISQKEFYSLFSYFNNVAESGTLQGESRNTEPVIPVPTAQHEADLKKYELAVADAGRQVAEVQKQLPELVASWEPEFRKLIESGTASWNVLDVQSAKAKSQAQLTRQPDGSYLASGANPPHDVYEVHAPLRAGTWTGLLLECFPDPSLPNQSLGRYPNGNFVLSRVEAEISAPGLAAPIVANFTRAEADYSQPGWDIKNTVAGDKQKGWAVDGPSRREICRAMFLASEPLQIPENATITVRLVQETLGEHNIGRFRLSATGLPPAAATIAGLQIPDALRTTLNTEASKRTDKQREELLAYYRKHADGPLHQAERQLAAAQKQLADFRNSWPTVMVMQEIEKPREAFVLVRGQYDKRGEAVTAGLPKVFPQLPEGAPNNRLGLARWIASRENPLTARVWVNRAWERFMGTGIVKTTENFGSQSEWPSHPELIDWLAVEFMEPTVLPAVGDKPAQPWDMKALQKLIVMSATYRQSSARQASSKLVDFDPDNRLLGRGPRFRLSGEILRDQALQVSGLLSEKVGGPSVRPYMPEGVWDETSVYGDLRNYKHDKDDGLYRRSLYTVWKRTAAPPTMLLFDAPNREICTVTRSRTNTPLQALSLLNEVTFVEAARKLGERMQSHQQAKQEENVSYGFQLVTGRKPSAKELAVLVRGLQEDLEYFKQNPEAAEQLRKQGEAASKADNAAELAAYTLVGNVLLNLDECIMRE